MRWKRWLGSRWVLALLAGLYPAGFYMSVNWYMFTPVHALLAVVSVALFALVVLVPAHGVGVWLLRKLSLRPAAAQRAESALFAAACVGMVGYLLRPTLTELTSSSELAALTVILAALITGLLVHRVREGEGQLSGRARLGAVLGMLCVVSAGGGLLSIATAPTALPHTLTAADPDFTLYDGVELRERPNVYLIVPDSYPSKSALRSIFEIDDAGLSEKLDAMSFTDYHDAFSNYQHTSASLSSLLGMRHHYYRGNIGNSDLRGARPFITSAQNPVVYMFRNNGYRVSYVHQSGYLFTMGCSVDSCSPKHAWFGGIGLLPEKVRRLVTGSRSLSHFESRALAAIDAASRSQDPHFTYLHFRPPGHSFPEAQTVARLADFRSDYSNRIERANATILKLVRHIVERDPEGLVIVNADHGAWGFGTAIWAESSVFDKVPDSIVALDHLGVLLAVRWPRGAFAYPGEIRSNVNLFRYVFSYLSDDEALLRERVPDDGFIMSGRGKDSVVFRAVRGGTVLESLEEVRPGA